MPSEAPASAGPFEPMVYPELGDAPCAQAEAPGADHAAYSGDLKRISAIDDRTVVFELCAPDVAFLSKIASPSFAINDTGWLSSRIDPGREANQAIVSEVNGTGPFALDSWNHGSDITMRRNETYWGQTASMDLLIFRWKEDATQRLVELQSGTVDGIDGVEPADYATVEGNADLQILPRVGLDVGYLGINNTYAPFDNDKIRRAIAMGIDRQRLTLDHYPPGSEVATHFTPCSIPNGCAGDDWYAFDPAAAKQLMADAGFPDGFKTKLQYRDVDRSYLPDPGQLALDIQGQLMANLGIDAEIEVQDSETFLDNADAGRLEGLHLLGWGVGYPVATNYPDVSNFLDFHFGAGASDQFGTKWDDITAALATGGSGPDDVAREPSYAAANDGVRKHVPMVPIAHAGSAVAYRGDVSATHVSPLGIEDFAAMTPKDRSQFVWMQPSEPAGLYCADETSGDAQRACAQMSESLYGYMAGSAAAIPKLAERCEPNAELTTWTCTLRSGVTFHDGATLDANDVVLSYASQWDADHPLHSGRDNVFSTFAGLFGGFLNPPPAPPAN